MALIGSDPEKLDNLGKLAAAGAKQCKSSANSITATMSRARWSGVDANDFRRRWTTSHRPQLHSAADVLDELARAVRREADEQRKASEGGGAGTLPVGAATPDASAMPSPPPRSSLEEQFAKTRRGMESDLEKAKRDLAALKERRSRDGGGLGDRIADLNPLDEGETEAQDRRIRTKASEVRRLEALLADPNRTFLKVDVRGDGRIIEVQGNLEMAKHVVIHVPGMTTDIDKYLNGGHTDANKLYERVNGEAMDNVAVIHFLDYDAPDEIRGGWTDSDTWRDAKVWKDRARAVSEVAGEGLARDGAKNLSDLVADLERSGVSSEKVTVVAHSYGSVLAGIALKDGMDVHQVIVVGSPGLGNGVDSYSDLGTDVPVWSAQAHNPDLLQEDWVGWAPGHGDNPALPEFGAKVFDGGSDGHSHYFEGPVLDRIAKIVVFGDPAGPTK